MTSHLKAHHTYGHAYMPDMQYLAGHAQTPIYVQRYPQTSCEMSCPRTRHRCLGQCETCWMLDGAAGICMDPAAALKTSHQVGTLDMPDMAPDKVRFLRV